MIDQLKFFDALSLGLRGQVFERIPTPYGRLPADAEQVAPTPVWNLGKCGSGLHVDFFTDSTAIAARQTLVGKEEGNVQRHDGVDLYTWGGNRWVWAGHLGKPDLPTGVKVLNKNLPQQRRRYRLYLPYLARMEQLEIGVLPESVLEPAPAEEGRPIVCYGTSIIQGIAASRPGMTVPAQLGRRLGRSVINLGFSGNARMDPGLEAIFARVDAAIFTVDPLPNMNPEQVTERTSPFIRGLRKAHPDMPIVLVENIVYPATYSQANKRDGWGPKNVALRAEFDKLVADGIGNLYYLPGEHLFGRDGDATVDAVHPSDLGMYRLADAYEAMLRTLL